MEGSEGKQCASRMSSQPASYAVSDTQVDDTGWIMVEDGWDAALRTKYLRPALTLILASKSNCPCAAIWRWGSVMFSRLSPSILPNSAGGILGLHSHTHLGARLVQWQLDHKVRFLLNGMNVFMKETSGICLQSGSLRGSKDNVPSRGPHQNQAMLVPLSVLHPSELWKVNFSCLNCQGFCCSSPSGLKQQQCCAISGVAAERKLGRSWNKNISTSAWRRRSNGCELCFLLLLYYQNLSNSDSTRF